MRVFALVVWTLLVGATGYTLFHITYEVEALEAELSELNRQITDEKQAIRVLEAEWAHLNRPARIERLSETLLPMLGRVEPAQVMRIDKLPYRDAGGVNSGGEKTLPSAGTATGATGPDATPASLETSEGGHER